MSPITGFTALAGEYRLIIELPGYRLSVSDVTVVPDETEDFHFNLVKKQGGFKFGAKEAVALTIAIPVIIALAYILIRVKVGLD